uniref:G_PROTEIN_RECEP_F1_2 domain-containing protein n=1 Tax=Elaeophora elaphi TaxID=1147741 RepID=A0A0R3RTK8_9BILA
MDEHNHSEDSIAMACIIVAWIFGLLSNCLALYVTRTMSYFRNAYGILCSSFLICNLQSISVLFTWCTIVLAVRLPILSSSELFLARLIGVLVNGPYYGSLFSHFFVALNRFCAVAYPIKYNNLWTESKALVAGFMSYILGTVLCLTHLCKECSLLFNKNFSYRFSYEDSYYGRLCAKADAAASMFIALMIACVDFITFVKTVAYRKSCLISFIYITSAIIIVVHPFLFTDKWLLFTSSTITWILMQSMDGIVILTFNRKLIWKTTSRNAKSIMPVTTFFQLQSITRH